MKYNRGKDNSAALIECRLRLKELRMDTGLTVKELAEKIGASRAFVNHMETGRYCLKLGYVEAVCYHCDISLSEFFQGL